MVGILLVSHGALGSGMIESAHMLAGEQEKLACLSLQPEDNVDELRAVTVAKIRELDDGDGVIVFVDMLGGSPFNMVVSGFAELDVQGVECVTGVNLPMLMDALDLRDSASPREVVTQCIRTGMEGIVDVKEKLGLDADATR